MMWQKVLPKVDLLLCADETEFQHSVSSDLMEKHAPVAFSPREFAALFKKEQSWGYRQIYKGNVATITEYGRILIPASEVERILATAGRYEGQKATPRTRKQLEKLKPELQSAWDIFVRKKRKAEPGTTNQNETCLGDQARLPTPGLQHRRAALERLSGKQRGPKNPL